MNIGIDIDGVLTNDDDYILACTSKFCVENNISFFEEPYEYEYGKLNWNEENKQEYMKQFFDKYVDEEPARKFAGEIIKKLKDEGHNIYIITGRHLSTEQNENGKNMRDRISKWLAKNNIVYDELICAKPPKIQVIKDKKLDIMIEDSPTTILSICNITHVFCYDARYNRNLICKNITRVFSWYDIYYKIKNFIE